MPTPGKQKANAHHSQAYQALILERESLLTQRSKCLGKKTFNQLNEKHQINYCGLNKKLIENYWQGFETARADNDFESAARDFQNAFEMEHFKAINLFLEIQPNTPLKQQTSFSKQPEDNVIKALKLHLGLGYPQNQKEAVRFYKKAAEQGEATAQSNLGVCYRHGIGVNQNNKEAVRLYRLAAEKGDASAQNNLGFCYRHGIGVNQNDKEAVRLYRLAAEKGDASAQNNLGVCYRHGIGVNQNDKEAVRLYRLAAKQGNALAQSNLGFCYEKGIGVNQNDKEAVRWFQLAAEQGNASAQNNLGFCYRYGLGVNQNYKEAVHWYRLAAEQGDAIAFTNLKNLKTPLANYTLALLEKNHRTVIELVLKHVELETAFFTKDIALFSKGLKDKPSVDSFLKTLQEQSQTFNKNLNTSLINALLALHNAISGHVIENNEITSYLMTKLLNSVSIADAEASQIKELMHFLCNIYDEDNSREVLQSLMKLWHRTQSFDDFQMDDSGLNQLIAAMLVRQLFGNQYCLQYIPDFKQEDIKTIIFAYENKKLTIEQTNQFLSKPLIIESRHQPKHLLPRLKACLANMVSLELTTGRYIEKLNQKLNTINLDDDEKCQATFDKLTKYAKNVLHKHPLNFFKSNKPALTNDENELLLALREQNGKQILGWIIGHEFNLEKNMKPEEITASTSFTAR